MENLAVLLGRIAIEPKISIRKDGKKKAWFLIAVNRIKANTETKMKLKKEGKITTDFISVVAFGKLAEIIEKYGYKGNRLSLSGSISTDNYEDKEGNIQFRTDIVAKEVTFIDFEKNKENTNEYVLEEMEEAKKIEKKIRVIKDQYLPWKEKE